MSINLLTPAEVAAIFGVDPKTAPAGPRAGKLTSTRTAGQHRRYFDVEIKALITGRPLTEQQRAALPLAYVTQVLGS